MKTPFPRAALWVLLVALLSAPLASAQKSSDVKDSIDTALRWLRAQQDPGSGSYGGVAASAWSLRAFCASPRAYVPGDGPFIDGALRHLQARARADGAICDLGAEPQEVLDQTGLVMMALGELPMGTALELLTGTMHYLAAAGERGAEMDPEIGGFPAPITTSRQARGVVDSLFEKRTANGVWGGEYGEAIPTARAILQLSSACKVLAAAERPPAPGAAVALPEFGATDRSRALLSLERGAAFLLETQDAGRWGAPGSPNAGLTAMAVTALQALPEPRDAEVQRAIDAGLDWLAGLQHEDGSIHQGMLANYVTSSAVMALARRGRPADLERVAAARAFLSGLQADEGEGYSEGDRFYGGIGYGGDERPDLSNLQMALDALVAAGAGPDDPALQKAVRFLERCQNRSESNDLRMISAEGEVIVSGNDGGGAYAPGDSKAGFIELPDGNKVPRSYGSMTYALLKGYLFAGLSKDDPRVQTAWKWLCAHYTLDINPGFEAQGDPRAPYQGLFYYFLTMARTLSLYGQEEITDAAGAPHPWRAELSGRLVAMQRQDGSWINQNASRWWEGNPILATCYAMQALDAALPVE